MLEAMACGKAVIVSEIPEFNYIIQNGAGISFRTGNVASLSESMKELMISNERKEMGKRGRDLVEDHTWDKIALRYEEFLNKIYRLGYSRCRNL